MRCRSAFVAIDSSSLRADFFIRRLYFATSFQVPNDVLERIVRFLFPGCKSLKVFGIFGEGDFDGLIYKLGNTALCFCSLQPQRPMQESIEVDGRSFLGGSAHPVTLAI